MRFTILGPVTTDLDGRGARPVKAPMRRTLLAALLLDANSTVSVERLFEILWNDTPPTTAPAALHNHVMRLRQELGEEGARRLALRPAGYAFEVRDHELDLLDFVSLLDSGRAARHRGDWHATGEVLAQALGLWQGEPFADVAASALRYAEAPRLAELRLQACEWRIDAELNLGRHDSLAPELISLTREHSLTEVFHAQLMLALYRSGRRADALAAFREARAVFVAELGLEPGPTLRRLHQRILAADPTLAWNPGGAGIASASRDTAQLSAHSAQTGRAPSAPVFVTPRQLPGDVRDFSGRASQIGAMDAALRSHAAAGHSPMVCSVTGAAGVGKTSLAVHWAHRVKDRFPDGQLYINLRGFDPSAPPLPVGEALRDALEALGAPTARIPESDAARSSLYRSLLAERRILVILDNAAGAEQARPLLPGVPGCAAVVTSRNQLTGLVATDGAIPVRLDLFTDTEAHQYVEMRLGPGHRAGDDERAAVSELIRLCARLPLALSIATARAAVQPGMTLSSLTAELRSAGGPLDALSASDPLADVRAVFSWSYRGLSDAAARVFRLLSVHPGPAIALEAVASLAGTPVPRTHEVLNDLISAHLLTADAGRYRFHDLLRAYSLELAGDDARTECAQALHRLADHYLHSALAASRAISPTRESLDVPPPATGVAVTRHPTQTHALDWCDAEHRAVHDVIGRAAVAGLDDHAWRTAWCLVTFLERRGHWHRHAEMQRIAVDAAVRSANRLAEAHARRMLARACARIGRSEEAEENLNRAFVLYETEGDLLSLSRTHLSFAHMLEARGKYVDALEHGRRAYTIGESAGHAMAMASALQVVGWYRACLGEHGGALVDSERALQLHRRAGSRAGEAATLDTIAHCHLATSDSEGAIAAYQQVLSIYRDIGEQFFMAMALIGLGDAFQAGHAVERAREAWGEALEILDDLGSPRAAEVLGRLAE